MRLFVCVLCFSALATLVLSGNVEENREIFQGLPPLQFEGDVGEDGLLNNERAFTVDIYNKDYTNEVKLLGAHNAAFWEEEKRFLTTLGIVPERKLSIVDLGCGPGHLAKQLLDWLPKAHVVCVEIDPQFVNISEEINAEHVDSGRFEAHVGSVDNTTLPSGAYDLVTARFVLQHLEEVSPTLSEARRLLRKSKKDDDGSPAYLVAFEGDKSASGIVHPPLPHLQELVMKTIMYRLSLKYQSSPYMARKLPPMLRRHGFGVRPGSVHLQMSIAHSDVLGMEAMAPIFHPIQFTPVVKLGLVKKAVMKRAIKEYRAFLQNPESMLGMYEFMIAAPPDGAIVPVLHEAGMEPEEVEDMHGEGEGAKDEL